MLFEMLPWSWYRTLEGLGLQTRVFTARCTTVQSAVLLSHVVCPSVRLWRWWIMTR